jgi:hypothetical protein
MSEFINNSELRKRRLKELIQSLHDGASFESVRKQFVEEFRDVTTTEISQMEQSLVKDGLPIEEVQRLCDVHASLFDGKVQNIHKQMDYSGVPGHPTHVMKEENIAIEALLESEIEPYLAVFLTKGDNNSHLMLRIGLDRLATIDRHYARKEYLLFPFLEKHGITAPPKVMWGVDDEIRRDIKQAIAMLSQKTIDRSLFVKHAEATIKKVRDMIFKEEQILIPLLLETLSFYEWITIDKAMPEHGYTLVKPTQSWGVKQEETKVETPKATAAPVGEMAFDAGSLSQRELNALLNVLPFDMTFVDKDDNVKYFTQGKERIFDRPKTIIGRNVSMCHPPGSVHVVEGILNDFKSGKKDHEDFWIRMRGQFVHIRYFAVRDKDGTYLGTLEVTQNIQPIVELEGEKRLVSQ